MGCARELKGIASEIGNQAVIQSLDALGKEVEEERFYLAVLGSFKRGKSTFINALLGSSTLPTGVVPLTSVVTKLSYSEEDKAVVRYLDGTVADVPLETIGEYITERGNPDNQKGIAEVEVLISAPLLCQGIILVDTPGIGSTYLGNTRTTYEFLSKLDAAIVVIGSDPPISQSELAFISEIGQSVERLFFVQNKIDCVGEEEWKEALLFSKGVLGRSLGSVVDIYPLSSKRGLEAKQRDDPEGYASSGIPSFEADLGHFIMTEKGRLLIRSASRKARKTLSDLWTALDLEQKVLGESNATLEKKVSWLKGESESVKRRLDEEEYLIDGGIDRITRALDGTLSSFKQQNQPRLLSQLEAFMEKLDPRLSHRDFTDQTERFISKAIERTYAPLIDQQEKETAQKYRDIVLRFEREVDALDEALRQEVSATFDIEIHSPPPSSLSIGRSRLFFDRASLLNYQSVLPAEMPFLLPKPLYRRAMKKKAAQTIVDELDKYEGKVRYDLVYRLSENARTVKAELRSRLMDTLQTINEAVQAGSALRDQVRDDRGRREQQIAALKAKIGRIDDDLRALSVR